MNKVSAIYITLHNGVPHVISEGLASGYSNVYRCEKVHSATARPTIQEENEAFIRSKTELVDAFVEALRGRDFSFGDVEDILEEVRTQIAYGAEVK